MGDSNIVEVLVACLSTAPHRSRRPFDEGRRDLCGAVDRQATRTSPILEDLIQILV